MDFWTIIGILALIGVALAFGQIIIAIVLNIIIWTIVGIGAAINCIYIKIRGEK